MRILIKEHGSVLSDLVFERQPIRIGSQPGSDVHLPDMRVHRDHAVLLPREDDDWIVQHLAGEAVTLINGHRLRDAHPVVNGDQISILDYTLNIYFDLDEESASLRATSGEVLKVEEYPVPYGTITRSKRENLMITPQQVDSIVRYALELSRCGELASVMETALAGLFQRFKARAAWLGLRRRGQGPLQLIQGRDHNGQVFDVPKLYNSLLYRCVDRGLSVWVPQMKDEAINSIIAVPLSTSYGRLGFVYLDSKKDAEAFGEQDFGHLMALSSALAQQLDATVEEQVRWRKTMTTAESGIVRTIQAKLDPHVVPEWPQLQIAVHCSPGQDLAGDIYDIMQLPNGAAAFFIGHVSAEPTIAAITLAEARTAFRIAVLHADMPHVMMQELNWLLCTQPEKVHMSSAIVMVDPNTGALLHSLAGPAGAVVIGQSGTPRRLDHARAPLLGTTPNYPYTTRKGLLGNKDSLAMYSPGLAKAQNQQSEELDEQRFLESLCDGFGMSARRALNETLSDISAYLESGYQPADVTILLAHRDTHE